MSISSDQATEAAMFLKMFDEAIETVRQSAIRNKELDLYLNFTTHIDRVHHSPIFYKLCNPKDTLLDVNNTKKIAGLVREVRAFQFSHYLFCKFLPKLTTTFDGDLKQLTSYLQLQNSMLRQYVQQ